MTENELQALFCAQLLASGWDVESQFNLGAKRVDIVASNGPEIHSYEVKLRDWRGAARQAFLNRPFFNRSFVVLPENTRRRIDLAWFADIEVGLIVVAEDGSPSFLVEPPRRDVPSAHSNVGLGEP